MEEKFLISTTGTAPGSPSVVILNDLGNRILVHPISDLDLLEEYAFENVIESEDLRNAINLGYIIHEHIRDNYKDDWFDFEVSNNIPDHKEGRIFYKSSERTLTLFNDISDVSLQIGRENWKRVKNVTAFTIKNGSPLYQIDTEIINGTPVPTVDLAAATDFTKSKLYGVATGDILPGSEGEATVFGLLRNLNTSEYEINTILYLSEIPGKFTNIPPPLSVEIARVVRSHESDGIVDLFSFVFPKRNNKILVRDLNDLPNPIGSPGIIELEDNTTYEFIGEVNIGEYSLKIGQYSGIIGIDRFLDGIVYEGSGYMIIGEDVMEAFCNELNIKAENGSLIYLEDTSGNEKSSVYYLNNTIIRSGTKEIGIIKNIKTIKTVNISIEDLLENGLTLEGSLNGNILIYDSLVENFTGTLLDFGTSVWENVQIDRNEINVVIGSPGNIGIKGLSNNGNLKTSPLAFGQITNNNFIGGGNYIVGISDNGTRWDFISNASVEDISDNIATGFFSFEDNSTITNINTINIWEKIAGTTIEGDNNLRFSMTTDNRLTYTGETEYKGNIVVTGSVEISAGSNNCEVAVFKNGSRIINVKTPFEVSNGKPNGFALTAPIKSSSNDYFEVFIRNLGANKDLTVTDLHLSIG